MLQVALRPAPVARGVVEDVRWHLLPAAAQVRELSHLVSRAAHESGLDEVVTEDIATERRPAGEPRQRAVLREGPQANDGVVTPVVTLSHLPVREPGGEHRALQPRAKLNQTPEERLATCGERERLQDADARVRFHRTRQCDERMAAHDAVGIEHDHVFVVGAPAPHEIRYVARLALTAVAAAAIEHPAGAEALAQALPQGLF